MPIYIESGGNNLKVDGVQFQYHEKELSCVSDICTPAGTCGRGKEVYGVNGEEDWNVK